VDYFSIFISLLGGVLPALLWLWFWLKEDRNPEPKSRLVAVFLFGMLVVFLVMPIEEYVLRNSSLSSIPFYKWKDLSLVTLLPIFLMWVALEELAKFIPTYFVAIKRKVTDEPIDAVIYMITAALGFAAMENTLYLLGLADKGSLIQSILTGNTRFLGATLLHIASSSAIGVTLGLSYYKKSSVRKKFLFTGVTLAVLLHAIFNLLIIKLENNLFFIFAGVWMIIVVLIVMIEKIKRVRY
jgi:RsiW-degrading membrane proteinase PrsW (M82 family)